MADELPKSQGECDSNGPRKQAPKATQDAGFAELGYSFPHFLGNLIEAGMGPESLP